MIEEKNMDQNRTILRWSITAVLAVVLAGTILRLNLNLREPVVLKQYTEYPLATEAGAETMEYLSLRIIQNRQEESTPMSVHFPENTTLEAVSTSLGTDSPWISGPAEEPGLGIGLYRVVTFSFKILRTEKSNEDQILTQARIRFSDGSTAVESIGKIVLYAEKEDEPHPISMYQSESDGRGAFKSKGYVETDMEIYRISSPILDDVAAYFDLTLNGQKLHNEMSLRLRETSMLTLEAVPKTVNGAKSPYTQIRFLPRIQYYDAAGEERQFTEPFLTKEPWSFDYWDMLKYLHELGAI